MIWLIEEKTMNELIVEKRKHEIIQDGGVPIRMWTQGVPVDDKAQEQLLKASRLPFIYKWMAVMPDVHVGIGATIGSVIPTKGAIIPAAVGVDIGCGMMAVKDQPTRHRPARQLARSAH
jgi:tRNA-splicing ligase RtcB